MTSDDPIRQSKQNGNLPHIFVVAFYKFHPLHKDCLFRLLTGSGNNIFKRWLLFTFLIGDKLCKVWINTNVNFIISIGSTRKLAFPVHCITCLRKQTCKYYYMPALPLPHVYVLYLPSIPPPPPSTVPLSEITVFHLIFCFWMQLLYKFLILCDYLIPQFNCFVS